MKSNAALRHFPTLLKAFKRSPNNSPSGNVTSAWVKGKNISVADYHYCHASANKEYHSTIVEPDAIFSKVHDKLVTDEAINRRYFEWLFNYSPFRNVFISKNARKAIDRGVIVASTDQPSNLVGGALIATRLGNERYQTSEYSSSRILIWDRLVALGVHPSLAFTIAYGSLPISVNGGALNITGLKTFIFDPLSGTHGHISLSPTSVVTFIYSADGKQVARVDGSITHNNFFHEKMPGANNKTFREFGDQKGSSYLWYDKSTAFNVNKAIKESLNKEFGPKIQPKTNPFAKAKISYDNVGANNGLVLDFNPAIEVIAKTAKEIVKEI